MSTKSQTTNEDKLEKALQALQASRKLQRERLSQAVAHANYDGEDVNKDGQSKWNDDVEDKLGDTNQLQGKEVEPKDNEDSSYTTSILTAQQQQEAIKRLESWLQDHSEAEAVRTQYLTLIERQGNRQQQRSAIAQTSIWLLAYPDAASVREQYLILIGKVGTIEQQQEAIVQTATWLQNHPEAKYVRAHYDALIEKQDSTAVSAVIRS